ncbi:uncharacterized protein FIBRA_05314 [Fibroporia radiculosa]|uniref:Uncharacterized protein n=1 Tax=Fibroporia radiculosa TaxID=599839 RepID=J4HXB1_9APHY|nr:uncharacterized protein FIBRA_05314 [Fibroporia radiculosa]CCM03192.1 predicted protein [Fibroporia radiculosa]
MIQACAIKEIVTCAKKDQAHNPTPVAADAATPVLTRQSQRAEDSAGRTGNSSTAQAARTTGQNAQAPPRKNLPKLQKSVRVGTMYAKWDDMGAERNGMGGVERDGSGTL